MFYTFKLLQILSESICVIFFHSETNLKVRQALPDTAEMGDDIQEFGRFNGELLW